MKAQRKRAEVTTKLEEDVKVAVQRFLEAWPTTKDEDFWSFLPALMSACMYPAVAAAWSVHMTEEGFLKLARKIFGDAKNELEP